MPQRKQPDLSRGITSWKAGEAYRPMPGRKRKPKNRVRSQYALAHFVSFPDGPYIPKQLTGQQVHQLWLYKDPVLSQDVITSWRGSLVPTSKLRAELYGLYRAGYDGLKIARRRWTERYMFQKALARQRSRSKNAQTTQYYWQVRVWIISPLYGLRTFREGGVKDPNVRIRGDLITPTRLRGILRGWPSFRKALVHAMHVNAPSSLYMPVSKWDVQEGDGRGLSKHQLESLLNPVRSKTDPEDDLRLFVQPTKDYIPPAPIEDLDAFRKAVRYEFIMRSTRRTLERKLGRVPYSKTDVMREMAAWTASHPRPSDWREYTDVDRIAKLERELNDSISFGQCSHRRPYWPSTGIPLKTQFHTNARGVFREVDELFQDSWLSQRARSLSGDTPLPLLSSDHHLSLKSDEIDPWTDVISSSGYAFAEAGDESAALLVKELPYSSIIRSLSSPTAPGVIINTVDGDDPMWDSELDAAIEMAAAKMDVLELPDTSNFVLGRSVAELRDWHPNILGTQRFMDSLRSQTGVQSLADWLRGAIRGDFRIPVTAEAATAAQWDSLPPVARRKEWQKYNEWVLRRSVGYTGLEKLSSFLGRTWAGEPMQIFSSLYLLWKFAIIPSWNDANALAQDAYDSVLPFRRALQRIYQNVIDVKAATFKGRFLPRTHLAPSEPVPAMPDLQPLTLEIPFIPPVRIQRNSEDDPWYLYEPSAPTIKLAVDVFGWSHELGIPNIHALMSGASDKWSEADWCEFIAPIIRRHGSAEQWVQAVVRRYAADSSRVFARFRSEDIMAGVKIPCYDFSDLLARPKEYMRNIADVVNGVLKPIKTGWEITSLSFILDWFTNSQQIAEWLQNRFTKQVVPFAPVDDEVWASLRTLYDLTLQVRSHIKMQIKLKKPEGPSFRPYNPDWYLLAEALGVQYDWESCRGTITKVTRSDGHVATVFQNPNLVAAGMREHLDSKTWEWLEPHLKENYSMPEGIECLNAYYEYTPFQMAHVTISVEGEEAHHLPSPATVYERGPIARDNTVPLIWKPRLNASKILSLLSLVVQRLP